LTAIALVFSIFQLNPAPFCMLDEVDAPLDDANVGRYARMVKEMSGRVQFIYITHNKIAMEMADQLMGVTMHEPGCSRLVSVNVEEAAALSEVLNRPVQIPLRACYCLARVKVCCGNDGLRDVVRCPPVHCPTVTAKQTGTHYSWILVCVNG